MVNPSLAIYSRQDSYLQKVKKLAGKEAGMKVDVAMHMARRIFERLLCQFYVQNAQEYLDFEAVEAPLFATEPFGDDSVRQLCKDIFENVHQSVSHETTG